MGEFLEVSDKGFKTKITEQENIKKARSFSPFLREKLVTERKNRHNAREFLMSSPYEQ